MHILVFGIPLYEGMAGSVRVRNLLDPISERIGGNISNLYFSLQADNCRASESSRFLEIDLNFKSFKSIFNYLKSAFRFINLNRSAGGKNVFYLYETPDLKTIIPLIYARLKGYKIVVDLVEDNSQALSFGGIINRLRIKSGSFILSHFQFLIDLNLVISSHLKEMVIGFNQDLAKVLYIPVTMDISKYPLKSEKADEVNRLFYGGSFGKKDGLDSLIKAFETVCKNYPATQLVLTGKGENKQDFDDIMKVISDSPYSENIQYKGFLSSEAYHQVLNSCDIFCVIRNNSSAANTGFPSKLAEYLATGKAVIVSNVGDVSSFLVNRMNALVIPPDSVDDLAFAIQYLIENPQKIKAIGAEGRKVAIQSFNNRIESEKLYRKLLAL